MSERIIRVKSCFECPFVRQSHFYSERTDGEYFPGRFYCGYLKQMEMSTHADVTDYAQTMQVPALCSLERVPDEKS